MPFLAILVFWLFIIFLTFSLFSDVNATAFAFLCIFALSASCAIYLILELNEPFNGLMMISDIPLRNALAPLWSPFAGLYVCYWHLASFAGRIISSR